MKYDGKEIPAGATHYSTALSNFYKIEGGCYWWDGAEWIGSSYISGSGSGLIKLPAADPYTPEVGTWCEFDCTAKGQECKNFAGYVEYMSEFTCVIKLKYPSRKAEFVAHPRTMKFRPLKTEHQRTAEAMYEVITRDDAHLHAESLFVMCEALANAGYRKS